MGSLTIVGLGPAGLDRTGPDALVRLEDRGARVIVRTLHHPAAAQLGERRSIETCDDLYESSEDLDEVYRAVAERVLGAAAGEDVVYAVPGSPLVGERTVALIRTRAAGAGVAVEVVPGESFLGLILDRVGMDPLEHGLQVLDGRALPDPLLLHLPTVIGQVDRPAVAQAAQDALGRVLPAETEVTVLSDLGGAEEAVTRMSLRDLHRVSVGPRTSLFLDPPPSGWPGLVQTNRRLRAECPWDRRQTHHSLVTHLVEETYELVEALSALSPQAPGGEVDYGAYGAVEEELGDLLLQVVFHATLATEAAGFGVEEVAEGIRRKLVRRHPHVFGDVEAHDAEEVLANWDRLKREEKDRDSLMDGVPASLPALLRADKFQRRAAAVGFDWPDPTGVLDKIVEEAVELKADIGDPQRATDELGDLLFSVVNLARHLGIDPEMALRRSADRFADRFRAMEADGALSGLSLEELDERWRAAKEG